MGLDTVVDPLENGSPTFRRTGRLSHKFLVDMLKSVVILGDVRSNITPIVSEKVEVTVF